MQTIKWKLFGHRWSIWTSFFDISRDVAMATDFVQKWAKLPTLPELIALSLRNGMGYRLADERINISTNCSTSCKKWRKSVQPILNASMPNERISYNFGTLFIFYPGLTQKLLNWFSPFLHNLEQLVELLMRASATIVHFVSEDESEEWRRSISTLARIDQN